MQYQLSSYIPRAAHYNLQKLFSERNFEIKIKKSRNKEYIQDFKTKINDTN